MKSHPNARKAAPAKPAPRAAHRAAKSAKPAKPSRPAPVSNLKAKKPARPGPKRPALPPLGLPRTAPPAARSPAEQTLARSVYFTELHPGDDLPPLTRGPFDRLSFARFSGASDDYNPLHLDDVRAKANGFPMVHAPPMLAMALAGQQLMAWLRRGRLRRLAARFVKLVWPGDTLTFHARIGELRRENGACFADLELWAENQKGELVVRGAATAELYESPDAETRGVPGGGLFFGSAPGARSAKPAEKPKPTKKR